MSPKSYVLDTSVVVKWFLSSREPHRDKAFQILNDWRDSKIEIVVPDLLIYELANALRFNNKISEQESKKLFLDFAKLKFPLFPCGYKLIESALDIAYKREIAIYDAIYLALAKQIKAKLITADIKHQMLRGTSIKLADY